MAFPDSSLKVRYRGSNRAFPLKLWKLLLPSLLAWTVTACDRDEKPTSPRRSSSRATTPISVRQVAFRKSESPCVSPESAQIVRELVSGKLSIGQFWDHPHATVELLEVFECLQQDNLELAKLLAGSAPEEKKQDAITRLLTVWKSDPRAAYQWLKELRLPPYQHDEQTMALVESRNIFSSGPDGEDLLPSWLALVKQLKEESLSRPAGALETNVAKLFLRNSSVPAEVVLDRLGKERPVSDKAFAYVIRETIERDYEGTMAYLADRPEERAAFVNHGGNSTIASAMIKQRPEEAVAWAMSLDNPATDCPAVRTVVFELISSQRDQIIQQVAAMPTGALKDAAVEPVIGWLAANGKKAAIPGWLDQISSPEVRQRLAPSAQP